MFGNTIIKSVASWWGGTDQVRLLKASFVSAFVRPRPEVRYFVQLDSTF